MSRLWTPPGVSREQLAEREQFAAQLDAASVRAKMLQVKGVLDEWNYHLRQMDERLELVRAQETIPAGIPMKPGYYHFVRWNEGAPPSVWPLQGEHGEFVEPTSRMLQKLKDSDLWNPRNMQRLLAIDRERDAQAEREKEADTQARLEEIAERVAAATRTQVSMNRDTPWAQNANGYRKTRKTRKWRASDRPKG